MRIVEIVSGHALNGAMRHALALARELSRRGHAITLVCRRGSWIARHAAGGNIDVFVSDLHRWPLDELRRVARRIVDCDADVVHTHMSRAHFFGVLLKTMIRTPVVATAHIGRIQPHWRFNDRTIAVSEAVRRFHRRWNLVPASRIDVVHPFVDPREFPVPTPVERVLVRRELDLDVSAPLIGVVGSVFREKGVHHVIRAMPAILSAIPAAQLAIVGDGPDQYRQRLVEEIERLGIRRHVSWLGRCDPIAPVMGALDVLVSPSIDEGLPLRVIEAMVSQVPVIAPALGGMWECVRDGETGLLVRPRDPAALSSACVRILANPGLGRRLGCAARADVLSRFTADTQVPRIESIFGAVAAARPTVAAALF
jgi:glycosyltransferase involved in cell wall biosynthesis